MTNLITSCCTGWHACFFSRPTEDYRDYLTERQISKLESVFLRYDRGNTGRGVCCGSRCGPHFIQGSIAQESTVNLSNCLSSSICFLGHWQPSFHVFIDAFSIFVCEYQPVLQKIHQNTDLLAIFHQLAAHISWSSHIIVAVVCLEIPRFLYMSFCWTTFLHFLMNPSSFISDVLVPLVHHDYIVSLRLVWLQPCLQ